MALNTVSSDRLSTNVKNTNFTAAEKQDLTDDILPLAGQLSSRNKVINGSMMIHQRGDASATGSAAYLSCDRFFTNNGSGAQVAVTKSTNTPDGFSASTKWDCTTADTSIAAGEYFIIQHRIEGQNVQDFAKGYSSAKQYALSFYIKATKTGVYTVELEDTDNARACSKTITVSDTNWNRYSLIFPADTTGSFNNDANSSLTINFWLIAGSDFTSGTFQTSAWGTRTSANRVSSSQVNAMDSTSNDFRLTGVQLEVGSVVTDFEHRSFGQELALCQRYYQVIASTDEDIVGVGFGVSSSSMLIVVRDLLVEMRAVPTIDDNTSGSTRYRGNYNTNSNTGNALVLNSTISNNKSVQFQVDGFSSVNSGTGALLRKQGSSGLLGVTAEL